MGTGRPVILLIRRAAVLFRGPGRIPPMDAICEGQQNRWSSQYHSFHLGCWSLCAGARSSPARNQVQLVTCDSDAAPDLAVGSLVFGAGEPAAKTDWIAWLQICAS